MQLLQLDHITVSYAVRTIFTDLSWAVQYGDRIGLIGPNGSGKSTLLNLITGSVVPDSGSIMRARNIQIGYLPQDVMMPQDVTLLEEALTLPPRLAETEEMLIYIENKLGDPAIYGDEDKLARMLKRQEHLLETYEYLGGPQHASRVREILSSLGFDADDYDLPAENLSGGQKKLVALTRLVAERPDVLLLDEPDNHLDVEAKRRLEKLLVNYDGAVIIVSHDRYLLDEIATEIAELEDGKLTIYKGNYTAYSTERELRQLRQQQLYVAQQKEIARIEAAIKRFELWASMVVDERHIKQARSRRKMLERMEANGEIIEKVTERRQMGLQLNGWRGSTKALELKKLTMAFDDDFLFVDLNLILRHGNRVGLVGPNGTGKSVILRLVTGQMEPLDGEIIIGPSIQTGYYSQEHETLAAWLDRPPLELVRDAKPMSENQAVSFLMRFLFSYEQIRQPIRTMSGRRTEPVAACLSDAASPQSVTAG